jgi:hypothetical protein
MNYNAPEEDPPFEYKGNTLTKSELYRILVISESASDRELEFKINQRIMQYAPTTEEYEFFDKVYDFFFVDGFATTTAPTVVEGNERQQVTVGELTAPAIAIAGAPLPDAAVQLNSTLVYTRDNLNPILKQTIKRTVVLDSLYRTSQYPFSTQYVCDLSEVLKDVVAMQLYAIQIPFTWYTINKDFGSNFILFTATSSGINNGNYDFKIEIPAGNYNAADLVAAMQKSLSTVIQARPDLQWGTTGISYNTNTTKAAWTLDFRKNFNEHNYRVSFPSSLQTYIGTTTATYPLDHVISLKDVLPFKASTATADQNNSSFQVTADNITFKLQQWKSVVTYDSNGFAQTENTTILQTVNISLTLAIGGGGYSRNQIEKNLQQTLQTHPNLLSNSTIERKDIANSAFSYYDMTLTVNPMTTSNNTNITTVVMFPDETALSFPIWSGLNSCFYFEQRENALNVITAEQALTTTSYIIQTGPQIVLSCLEPEYASPLNEFTLTVANSPDLINGYTLAEYVAHIQSAINVSSDLTNSLFQLSSTSVPQFQWDINRTFANADYTIDFDNSVLQFFYGIEYATSTPSGPLSTKTTFTGSLENSSNYSIPIDAGGITTPFFLFVVRPQPTSGNQLAQPFQVPFTYQLSERTVVSSGQLIYTSYLDLISDINRSISLFTDTMGDNVLTGTQLTNTGIQGINYVVQITVNVLKVLTQQSYSMTLADSTWSTYLFFQHSAYDLLDYDVPNQPYSLVSASAAVQGTTITVSPNTVITATPLDTANGLSATANEIAVTVPAGTYINTQQLLNAINYALTQTPETTGSFVSIVRKNNQDFSQFSWNINKAFTTADFSMVFYDTVNFVKCYVGDKSVRNTTWDTTVGWILGFQENPEYVLADYVDPTTNIAVIEGNTCVNVNLYNYLLLSVDDFNQNRINDGVVTITPNLKATDVPNYSNITNYSCDANGNKVATGSTQIVGNNLTNNQLYSINQNLKAQINQQKQYTTGPFVKDMFATIPMKLTGLQNGQTYVETSGQLQQQERLYFGPVNIHRFAITLYTDKGTILDLNGSNFVVALNCEQLYQKTKL